MRPVESVWDYPRPPAVEPVTERVQVVLAETVVADSRDVVRVVETSHPPAYYVPPSDVSDSVLRPIARRTLCEFKGVAHYFDVVAESRVAAGAAWSYPEPAPGYEQIRGYVAFYPSKMDECWVGDQLAQPQPGSFYGGWVTSEIIGPFKRG